jgi:hypothetical protein
MGTSLKALRQSGSAIEWTRALCTRRQERDEAHDARSAFTLIAAGAAR